MFTEKHVPDSITGEELDDYLDRGWYRMGQSIFTCHFLFFNDSLYLGAVGFTNMSAK